MTQDSLDEIYLVDTIYDPRKYSTLNLSHILTRETGYEGRYFRLAGLLNFQHLSRFRLLKLRCSVIESDSDRMGIVEDMRAVLSRISPDNPFHMLDYRVQLFGNPPFTSGMVQNWRGLAEQIAHVANGKSLDGYVSSRIRAGGLTIVRRD